MKTIARFLPITLLGTAMLIAYLAGFYKVLDFETLRYHHVEMVEFVNNNPLMTPFMFMGYCAGTTILSIPGEYLLSLLAGFLFPQPWGTLYLLIGATLGASVTFWIAKIALGSSLQEKLPPWYAKVQAHVHQNIISYMLFLRLIPLMPFWFVNLIPAFFNVRLRTYIWTTFVGTIPGALILTESGKGLNNTFESADAFSIQSIMHTEIQIVLVSLAAFCLLPLLIKKLRKTD